MTSSSTRATRTSARRPVLGAAGVLVAILAAHHSTTARAFHAPAFVPRATAPFSAALRIRRPNVVAPLRTSGIQQQSMLLGFSAAANPMALAALPVLAFNTAKTVIASANPVVFDCIFAGLLYVLGKMTSNAFSGKQGSLPSLAKWFTCGLVDGWACHAWYAMLEFNFGFLPVFQQMVFMNGLSSVFFTPAYCACFLVLLSLLEFKGLSGALDRVGRDWKDLASKSVQVWGVLNIPLFLCVPLHLRVVFSMGLHYLYLVGLGVWDAKTRQSVQGAPASTAASPWSKSRGMDRRGLDQAQGSAWGDGEYGRGSGSAQPALNLALAKVPLDDMNSHYGIGSKDFL